MKKIFQDYFNSFKLKKLFLHTFLADLITFGFISFIITFYSGLTDQKFIKLLNGQTPEQVKELMISNPEQFLPIAKQLQSVVFSSIFWAVIIFVGCFFLYTYSRKYIWEKIESGNEPLRKWSLLNLSLIIPLIIFLILLAITKLIIFFLMQGIFFGINTGAVSSIIDNLLNFLLVLILVIFIFTCYRTFNHKGKIWESIGNGFDKLKHIKKNGIKIIFGAFTALVITAILILTRTISSLILPFILSSFFLSWFRLYYVTK